MTNLLKRDFIKCPECKEIIRNRFILKWVSYVPAAPVRAAPVRAAPVCAVPGGRFLFNSHAASRNPLPAAPERRFQSTLLQQLYDRVNNPEFRQADYGYMQATQPLIEQVLTNTVANTESREWLGNWVDQIRDVIPEHQPKVLYCLLANL